MWRVPIANLVVMAAIALLCIRGHQPAARPATDPVRSVRDGCGYSVSLGRPAGDLVLLTPSLAEYLFVTRSPDRLLSGYEANGLILLGTALRDHFPSLLSGRVVNDRIPRASNSEWLLAQAPRVVFDWPFHVEFLKSVGVPAVCLNRGTDLGLLQGNAATMEAARGDNSERTVTMGADYTIKLALVKSRLTTSALGPRTVFLSSDGVGHLSVMSRQNDDPDAMEAARLEDVTPRGMGTMFLDPEVLLMTDPDLIVLTQAGLLSAGPGVAQFLGDARWSRLQAVRSARVYAKPRGLSIYFSGLVETPLYASWLAEIAHPSDFPRVTRTSMRTAYEATFGEPFSDAELDDALRGRENAQSRGYERFIGQRRD